MEVLVLLQMEHSQYKAMKQLEMQMEQMSKMMYLEAPVQRQPKSQKAVAQSVQAQAGATTGRESRCMDPAQEQQLRKLLPQVETFRQRQRVLQINM
jgi:hypothetical protein